MSFMLFVVAFFHHGPKQSPNKREGIMTRSAFHTAILCLFALAFHISFAARPAWATQPQQQKLVLGLQEMVQRAIDASPEVAGSLNQVEMVQNDLAQVQAAYRPQLDVTAITGPSSEAVEPLVVNGRITDPSPATTLSNIGIFGRLDFTVTQPLYTFGKLSNRKLAAQHGVTASQWEVIRKQAEIALRVKQLYYALILAGDGISVSKNVDSFFEDASKRIQRLLELDSPNVSPSDRYQLDARRAIAVRGRAASEKGYRVAYFGLKSLIRLPEPVGFEPADRNLRIDANELPELQTYIRRARDDRPEFRQINEALEARKYEVKAARSDQYPSLFLALQGSFAGAPNRDTIDSPYIEDQFNHAEAGLVAGLEWHFDFGIMSARVRKKRAEYARMRNTKASAELNIPIQVAQLYEEVREWKRAAQAYHDASVAARKWVITAISDFEFGVGTADNMIKAIEKYGENEGDYLESLYEYHLSLAQLDHATGVIDWKQDITQ